MSIMEVISVIMVNIDANLKGASQRMKSCGLPSKMNVSMISI